MLRSLALIALTALCLGCAHQIAQTSNIGADTDVAEIYGRFLDDWAGKEKDPINVSFMVKAPSAEDFKEFSDCADKGASPHWLPVEPIDDLANLVGSLPYVRFVDPGKWNPLDPSSLMAQGQTVESAVDNGSAHGLLTFSAIAFDPSHETAVFTYSFVCGDLCGNGGTVIFKKVRGNWVRSKGHCGSWISYSQAVNNSKHWTKLATKFNYIEMFYNRQRKHSSLGYRSLEQFERLPWVA